MSYHCKKCNFKTTKKNHWNRHLTTKKHISNEKTIITNARHYEELKLTLNEINEVIENISNDVSSDLYSISLRKALDHLGSITGEVTNDTLLGNIFSKFCIGK